VRSASALDEARQATGEPPRSCKEGMAEVETEIARLDGLARHALRALWRKHHRCTPPVKIGRDLMIRAIAYKIQERAYGGLSLATLRRLRSLAQAIEDKGASAFDPGIALKPGARLIREWHGRTHTVIVLDDGFEYDGRRYRSLTRIAKLITGAHWSGPVFFGAKKRTSRAAVEASHE
jgi:Protein of unknown function (DUF2924)